MVMDFKKGKISLDELSIMSGYLWGYMDEKSRLGSSLGDTLEAASELSFYIRVVQDQECADTFIYFLRKVLKYFDKYAGLPV
jgi:hypothetical protein